MRELFGTDGIRSKAGAYPLDDATMFSLGRELARSLGRDGHRPLVLLGMDSRESGPGIASALAAGISQGGGDARLIGIIPTPGVAYLCHSLPADAGISISASHNPWQDNGVKVFGRDGMKLSDQLEKELEQRLLANRSEVDVPPLEVADDEELIARYEKFLLDSIAADALAGIRVVLDTGNGAACRIAPEVFRNAGAEVIALFTEPDGRNINEGCGALHPEQLAEKVVESGAAFGVAFDGDADRAIFADDRGRVRDGDEVLCLWARHQKAAGRLKNDTVVATVMSNLGFEKQLAGEGIRLIRASVGDKYVLEKMIEHGAVLGGEQSGHVIDLTVHTTGDGVHTALAMAELIGSSDVPLSEMHTFDPMPQILLNEKVAARPPLETLDGYQKKVSEATERLDGRGRILVRYSGTENLVRVMVEGEDRQLIEGIARELADLLREEIARHAPE
jgi:phosphoglucosamine mutase